MAETMAAVAPPNAASDFEVQPGMHEPRMQVRWWGHMGHQDAPRSWMRGKRAGRSSRPLHLWPPRGVDEDEWDQTRPSDVVISTL